MEKEHTQRLRSILGGLVLFHGEVRGALESSKLKLLEVEMERLMGTCQELEAYIVTGKQIGRAHV